MNWVQGLVCVLIGAVLILGVRNLVSARNQPIPPPAETLEWSIAQAAGETGVPQDILTRLLISESGLDPDAEGQLNPDGSRDLGIAQLSSRYIEWFAMKYGEGSLNPFDYREAVPVAARYLADLYKLFGCWTCAVGAYKVGPTKWAKSTGVWTEALNATLYRVAGHHSCGK